MKRITIQGQPGCFHETAARCSFPGEQVEILPCDSFDQQFARMAADPTLLGIAAIENTIAGSLLPNHELLRRSSLAVIGEYKLRISHVLAALPGEAPCDIGEVHSHPIALMQCGDYLKAHPAMKVVERDDTAGSAREIADLMPEAYYMGNKEMYVKALEAGAFALVVGGAITRPAEITARFTGAINAMNK